jgi:hypothetical protein
MNNETTQPAYDEVGQIIAYEQGELSDDETVVLFQHLIDNGHAWSLQGHYGRTGRRLIAGGLCHANHLGYE